MTTLLEPHSTRTEMLALLNGLNELRKGRTGVRLPADWTGVAGKVADAFNDVVELNERLAEELTRLSKTVGKEGRLQQRLSIGNVSGFWREKLESVNNLIDDLVQPITETARVIGSVAQGDLSKTMGLEIDNRPLQGEFLRTAKTINKMVDQLGSFASEVTRVAREVGTEGKLGGQAQVKGVAGTWKDLTDSVNGMAGNLTAQVRNVAEVTTAVANGDLSKKIAVDVKGEFLELKDTINTMVDQLRSFASEVTRVAREVGTEGKLGGQAQVEGVSGTWKDLTDSVNGMAGNLTAQVRNIAAVTTAVANGDLSRKITVDVKGEILELKNTVNTMVDQLSSFAAEVTRVAREVGTEGKLGGQADVPGVAGVWANLTDSVNFMAGNLTAQVRNIAEVTTAVATGDLSQKITVDVRGEILELKNTVNTMVDQLSSFAAEVTRVAREVGTEGQLGGQADVRGVAGVWKNLTDSVNFMAGNLTGQVRNIADVTKAVAAGDLSRKITVDVKGEILELKNTVNTMVDQLSSFAAEVTRVAREVGTEGKLGGQADVKGVAGTWKDLTDSVNFMAGNLTSQVRNIADVTKAVAAGDLSRKITVDVKGEILELKNTVNTMVDQLRSFGSEVTRVAREVGTEGKLGGQAQVEGVSGTWKDLTDSVNSMAANLTAQVRGIAKVVTAVANGDLKRKLTVEAKGEIAELAETINEMIDTLATFADQVTTVAREVGVEGQLGGQAKVPGAAGIWKALTENVNQLAANLTTQVRAIADVATSVTTGNLTRSIKVEAQGEVAALSSTINEMIRNLRDTTQKNMEQDWLKTNLAKFSRMLQGQRDLTNVGRMVLSELCPVVEAHQAEFYVLETDRDPPQLMLLAGYASDGRDTENKQIRLGQGIVGQCALEKQKILLENLPPDYIRISSGLGSASPRSVLVLPLIFEGQVRGVLELASLSGFNPTHQAFLEQLTESIGIVLNTIEANMRTEGLLQQSQSLAQQLQSRQEQLQNTNEELQEKAQLLAHQNHEVERKNQEVEQARQALEEKAKQLALTSKYKSEFLANMSHELRTPLNSLLILSDQLTKNSDQNLNARQLEFAKTIHSSGNDLLMLINDILDLSKIESGTVLVDASDLRLDDLRGYVERTFRHVAESKNLAFFTRFHPRLPVSIYTDSKRLQQIIKNLLSNAFKFTQVGQVTLTVEPVTGGWNPENDDLNRAEEVISFGVADSGIGIPLDKQQIIFEAFQQADGSTSRKYGGTGLGLAISRELSRLLGGEIRLASTPGRGSTFQLFLPVTFTPPRSVRKTVPSSTDTVPASLLPTRPFSPSEQNSPAPGNDSPQSYRAETDFELVNEFGDDRDDLRPGNRVLLIVENDAGFARILLDAARRKGFKGLVTTLGASALTMTREYNPDVITLDIHLPDIDGWRVLERLKRDSAMRHIPVCVISTDDARDKALASGAIAFVAKPIPTSDVLDDALRHLKSYLTKPSRNVLLVADKIIGCDRIESALASLGVQIQCVDSIPTAVAALATHPVDCLVIVNPQSGFARELAAIPAPADVFAKRLPIILFEEGATTMTAEVDQAAPASARYLIRHANTIDSLLNLASFHLHRPLTLLNEADRQRVLDVERAGSILANKKVLIVDDDIRNIFALSAVLEEEDMVIVSADNGRDAIRRLKEDPEVDFVLMDIMMPDMDGMETMREIRKVPHLKNLPIVAVTAKAMKGDREKCLEAGAWDYLSKPVDPEQVLSVLRAWLKR
jgi:HAMP domain-containing protein/signal transduction histidine kinase/DNA-binding response OmpR family regulator